jgi:thiamine biosynthesis protein ThiS
MKILLNGKISEEDFGTTLVGLMAKYGLIKETTVIEINGSIIERGRVEKTIISENDMVELIRCVGGG